MNNAKVAWDTTVLLAWLCEDARYDLSGIEAVIQEITPPRKSDSEETPRAILLMSVVAYSEILEAKHSPEQMQRLRGFRSRSNMVLADNDIRIAQKAGDSRKIKTPDATPIAMALIYKANVFHTFDEGMLALNHSQIVDGLAICKPTSLVGQGLMF